jgi:hypothetical protein
MISSFLRDLDEISNLLGYYASQIDDGTDRLSRNVGKELALYAAY